MSLRARVTLLLSAAIILAVGFAGYATRETAIQPLRADLMRGHVHEAMQIALTLRQGSTLDEVREEGGPDVSLLQQAPAGPREVGPGRPWTKRRMRGRSVLVRRGPNPAVAIQLKRRWLLVEPRTSTDTQKLLWVLFAGGLSLLGGAVFVGRTVTRPLRDAQIALQRVGEGDLSQRLPVRGGEELEAVAKSFNAMTERIDSSKSRAVLEGLRAGYAEAGLTFPPKFNTILQAQTPAPEAAAGDEETVDPVEGRAAAAAETTTE